MCKTKYKVAEAKKNISKKNEEKILRGTNGATVLLAGSTCTRAKMRPIAKDTILQCGMFVCLWVTAM